MTGCESTPPAPPTPVVKLSAGVALPQLGPEGTLMMFSVDYRFMEGSPDPGSQYAWVIEPAKGEPLEQPIQAKRAGNLQAIAPQWRPENGPFKSRIDEVKSDGTRRTLSELAQMR
jgi:hypothetical protein